MDLWCLCDKNGEDGRADRQGRNTAASHTANINYTQYRDYAWRMPGQYGMMEDGSMAVWQYGKMGELGLEVGECGGLKIWREAWDPAQPAAAATE